MFNTVRKANAVCLNADSQRLSFLTQDNFTCILQFALLHFFSVYTTVILIGSFASVFNGNTCFSKQNNGCVVLRVLGDIQGLMWSQQGCLVAFSKLETQMFELGWMARWKQFVDKDKDFKLHSEKEKASCRKHPNREVSKPFLQILVRRQLPLSTLPK